MHIHRRVQATQVKVLRRVEGVSRLDGVRDVDIWEELQQEGGLDVLKEQQGIRKMKVDMSMGRNREEFLKETWWEEEQE